MGVPKEIKARNTTLHPTILGISIYNEQIGFVLIKENSITSNFLFNRYKPLH